ncbi:MAG: fused MFS/spermidine synthase, partial [Nitrospiria bacterium]
ILLPSLGIQKTLHLAIMINALLALALWFFLAQGESIKKSVSLERRLFASGGVLSFFLVMTFSAPTWDPLAMSSDLFGQERPIHLLYYEEGISATVTVVQHQTLQKIPHLTLAIDGKPNASTTGDMKTQLLVAHLPMLLAKQEAKEVLLIGHGSGITTGSMATHPITELITLELEPAVIEGARFFDPFNGKILDDPRVTLEEDDARNYLLRTDKQFDVIVSEPSHPWRSGSAKLFTREFFQIGKDHLRTGGIFSQWIHFYGIRATELKSVIKTFHTVFDQVMIFYTDAGDLIMLGSEIPFQIDRTEITRRMKERSVAKDLSRAGVYSIYDLWSHFLLGPNEIDRYVGDAVLNTDDFTLVEFQTPKSLFEDTISIHIAEMKGAASTGGDYLFGPDEPASVRAKGDYEIAKSFFRVDKMEEAGIFVQRGFRLQTMAEGDWVLGRLLLKEGDRQGAEAAWLRGLDKDPAHQEILLSLGKFFYTQGAFKKAATYLEKIEVGTPVALKAAYYQGVSLYFKGDYEAALEALQLGALFSEPFVYYYQKQAHEKLGHEKASKAAMAKFIMSLDEWRRELELTPKKYKALPYLKAVEWRREVGIQIPEEERMALLFERVVGTPLNHLYSGAGLYLLKHFDGAAKELEQGIQKLGRQASGSLLNYYLGLTYQKLGVREKSNTAFKSFIKRNSLSKNDIRVVEARRYVPVLN